MKCSDCLYKETIEINDDEAFDVKGKKLNYKKDVDICTLDNVNIPRDDAYPQCQYREITVEAQHIQHAINLLHDIYIRNRTSQAIDHLNKILLGDNLE